MGFNGICVVGDHQRFIERNAMFSDIIVLRESSENEALQTAVAMQKGKVMELTAKLSINASKLSLKRGLPMADSIILKTAQVFNATIWIQVSKTSLE